MQLDTRTLVVVSSLVALAPTIIGAMVWRTRQTCPGFGRWTLGNFLALLGLFLVSLRGIAPDGLSIVVANASTIGAAILFLHGIRIYRGLRLYWWPEFAAAGLAIAAVTYFRYATDDLNARIIATSAFLGTVGVICGATLLREISAGHRLSEAFTGIVLVLSGAANLARGIYAYSRAPVVGLFDPSGVDAIFFAAVSLAIVAWSFGFIMIASETGVAEDRVSSSTFTGEPERIVPAAEVRSELQRIVTSDLFRRSARMEQFLSLAVERTLAGHPEELKEYSLGRDVFNRGENYDPRADSIVRVEAQRLRRKLREYYKSYGRDDSVIVEFHAGSYVPLFRYRDPNDEHYTAQHPVATVNHRS